MNRNSEAAYIWYIGASNPIAILKSMISAIEEIKKEEKNIYNDPALILMLDQLNNVLKYDIDKVPECWKIIKNSLSNDIKKIFGIKNE